LIVGTGVDLAEVSRIRSSMERFGDRFRDRVFTPLEVAYVAAKANKYERYV
jgi:holo-[acyl-carrier protein] synthase